MNLIQDVMGFLIQVGLLGSYLVQAPMITKLLLGGPEKGERTPRTGKTTALLLSITPFLEVIINFMASSQMKLRVLLLPWGILECLSCGSLKHVFHDGVVLINYSTWRLDVSLCFWDWESHFYHEDLSGTCN
ncbi:hypothetical protein RDI58_018020 [Solanum bulbocastanum]|uniref:Uncharacterized protein n=1 Tax=Solanum bulbocastanum TaxID=147425 RepID=A0AAN8TAT7_SOLBU